VLYELQQILLSWLLYSRTISLLFQNPELLSESLRKLSSWKLMEQDFSLRLTNYVWSEEAYYNKC